MQTLISTFADAKIQPEKGKLWCVEESKLVVYLKKAADIYYSLSPFDLRKFAYEFGVSLQKKIPNSWKSNKTAGSDWFYGFMRRHTDLSIRKPQAASLSRATTFNVHNVSDLFHNVEKVMRRAVKKVSTRRSAKSTVQLQENQDNNIFVCLICQESWSDSLVVEKWVQCINCKQ